MKIKSLRNRLLLFPIIFIWWLIQLTVFSLIGGFLSLMFGIMGLILSLILGDNIDIKMNFIFIFGWVIAPFIWWYRYFKFGDIKILKEFRNLMNNKNLLSNEEEFNYNDLE